MTEPHAERPWTVAEAAEWLSRSEETVRRMARDGRLRGRKLAGGRDWRFRPEDVRALTDEPDLEQGREVATIVEAQMHAAFAGVNRRRSPA